MDVSTIGIWAKFTQKQEGLDTISAYASKTVTKQITS